MRKLLITVPTFFAISFAGLAHANTEDSFDPEGAAPPVKVEICHFDEEAAAWVKLRLPERPAAKHLEKHDDAVPGGVTTVTATQLDAACVAAAPV